MKIALDMGRRTREIVLPEGVPLRLEVAGAGDRAAAFLLDLLIVIAATFVCVLLAGMGGATWEISYALAILGVFLIRNVYFVAFEGSWGGQTPGKRAVGIRVISRDGGPLRPEAIFARNLTRELEVFMPGAMLAFPELVSGDTHSSVVLVSLVWMLAIGFMPLFNRDRLRVGDLLAGTLVVQSPEVKLDADVVVRTADAGAPIAIAFTSEQLTHYGVYELQVLEDVLRDRLGEQQTVTQVAVTIQRRIGWSRRSPVDPRDFLRAFYKAQREQLERDLLLGRARERKVGEHDGAGDG